MTKADRKAEATIRELQWKYAAGELSKLEIAKCEAIPGWDWGQDLKLNANPSPEEIETWIAYQRKRHAEGTLPKWKVRRLEQIKGWSWSNPVAAA